MPLRVCAQSAAKCRFSQTSPALCAEVRAANLRLGKRGQKPDYFFVSRNMTALGQGEEHDLFAGDRADVMVQTYDFGAGDLLDHGLHDRPGRFDQMRPHLFEQVSRPSRPPAS